jgi:hypothetical protein
MRLHVRSTFAPNLWPTRRSPHHQSGVATIASKKKITAARLTWAEMAVTGALQQMEERALRLPPFLADH